MKKARLLAVNPIDRRPREFTLSAAEVTVGSEPGNSLLISEETVSRRHAVIRRSSAGWEVRDLQSTNGTFVNEKRLAAPQPLRDGDRIRFGGVRFVFLDPGAGASAKARRRLSLVRAAELLLILFVGGFALSKYLMSREAGKPAPQTVAPMPREAAAILRPLRVPGSAVTPGAPKAEPSWLARLNFYRAMARLPAVGEDPALSDSDSKHARYLIENYGGIIRSGGSFGETGHEEEPTKAWYTPEGSAAARSSDVAWGCGALAAEKEIDHWMAGPFHRLAMLNPDLKVAGFGEYENSRCWAAALRLPLEPRPPLMFDRPIEFPPDGATISLGWTPGEWPPPLASCPGYAEPAGLPITLQLGQMIDTQLSAHSLTESGKAIDHCVFDAASYTNADRFSQEYARRVLRGFGAVVIIPREPLRTGADYSVSITAAGRTYSWSFKVAASD
ncbi:MAG: FHA domain-containing protein [Candidatus Binataceae bacterium]